MNYIEEYSKRHGCENCSRNGTDYCHECYGYSFRDKLNLFEFIKDKAEANAINKFDNSERGIELITMIKEAKAVLEEAEIQYKEEKEKAVDEAIKKLENQINNLEVE
jgi:hypothetical protein